MYFIKQNEIMPFFKAFLEPWKELKWSDSILEFFSESFRKSIFLWESITLEET